MRCEIYLRTLRSIQEKLLENGIASSTPLGGSLFGTITLHEHSLILRVDVLGRAMLYDPSEGTMNNRIPKHSWTVPEKGAGFIQGLIEGVLATVKPVQSKWVQAIGPDGPIQGLSVARDGEGLWQDEKKPASATTARPNLWMGLRGAPSVNRRQTLLYTFKGPKPEGYHAEFVTEDETSFHIDNLMWAPSYQKKKKCLTPLRNGLEQQSNTL